MASPFNDTRIVRFLFDQIGASVEQFINSGSADMIGIIGPVAVSLLTIYVLLWGVAMASGQISEPFTDGMKRIVRICIIVGFALTVGIYQGTVVQLFKEAPVELASMMTMPGSSGEFTDNDTFAKMLDDCLAKGFEVAAKPWDKGTELHAESWAGISGEGMAFQVISIMLYLIAVIIVAIAAGIVFVAYMALAILLALGPLFILMAIFPATQRWFESWLGQVVNYGLLFLLMALATGLLFTVLEDYFSKLTVMTLNEVLMATLKAIGLSIAMSGVLLQLNSVAAALAGGAAMNAAGVAGKLAGMGMAAVTGGAAAAGMTRAAYAGARGRDTPSALTNRDYANKAGGAVRAGYEMARKRHTNTARQG